MTARKLEKNEWRPFLDGVSKVLEGSRAEIEVASLNLGNQEIAGWLPLIGIVYDPRDDLVEVALEGFDHLIRSPRDIFVDVGVGGLASIEIVDGEGANQIVKVKEPLALPPPQ